MNIFKNEVWQLTALNLQRTRLCVQRKATQVHVAHGCDRDSAETKQHCQGQRKRLSRSRQLQNEKHGEIWCCPVSLRGFVKSALSDNPTDSAAWLCPWDVFTPRLFYINPIRPTSDCRGPFHRGKLAAWRCQWSCHVWRTSWSGQRTCQGPRFSSPDDRRKSYSGWCCF